MNNSFSSRIKELRTSLKMTQSDFASLIGSAQNALSGYENGDRTPSYELLMSIAENFDISIDWLLGLSDKKFLRIETYSDAFQLLINLCSTKYQSGKSSIIFPTFNDEMSDTYFVASEDPNFHDFFTQYKKMYDLYESGTIDDELYQLWITKELAKYNFPLNKLPSCFN